jgi:nucleoside-diphosphate kinase
MVKPDGVQRGLIGEIVARFERKGYKMVAAKFVKPTREHREFKPSAPVIAAL